MSKDKLFSNFMSGSSTSDYGSEDYLNSNNIDSSEAFAILGERCTINGDFICEQSVKVEGRIVGNLKSKGLVILTETSHIEGNIDCEVLVIYGRLDGNCNTKSLELKSKARVNGDIHTRELQCDTGARYKGSVSMDFEGNVSQDELTDKDDNIILADDYDHEDDKEDEFSY